MAVTNLLRLEAPPWLYQAQAHLLQADERMAALVRRQGPVWRPLSREYFSRLARAIVGQQISVTAATSIYGKLVACAGEPLTPHALATISEEELRACGLSKSKIAALRDLAEHALDGRLDLAHLETLPDVEVARQLVAVRGIGPWTADMFLMFSLGRPDILAAGDLGVQNAAQRLYHLEARPSPTALRSMAQEGRWHPYATAACLQLWESLKNDPL